MTRVEMYTTAICPYCVSAKAFLQRKGLAFEEKRIDQDPALRDEMLARAEGLRSVPQIFINDHHVGGYDDLVAADRSGKLKEILDGGG